MYYRADPSLDAKDNCCLCNTAALKAITGLDQESISYITFHNKIYEVCFFRLLFLLFSVKDHMRVFLGICLCTDFVTNNCYVFSVGPIFRCH